MKNGKVAVMRVAARMFALPVSEPAHAPPGIQICQWPALWWKLHDFVLTCHACLTNTSIVLSLHEVTAAAGCWQAPHLLGLTPGGLRGDGQPGQPLQERRRLRAPDGRHAPAAAPGHPPSRRCMTVAQGLAAQRSLRRASSGAALTCACAHRISVQGTVRND
jgi:hypothetical protein